MTTKFNRFDPNGANIPNWSAIASADLPSDVMLSDATNVVRGNGTGTPLTVIGATTGFNPAAVFQPGVDGNVSCLFLNYAGDVMAMIENGYYYTVNAIVISGAFTGTYTNGTLTAITTTGALDGTGLPAMFVIVSDVNGPSAINKLNNAAGTAWPCSFYLCLDSSKNYIHTVESDGSHYWGVGSTHASMDAGLMRVGSAHMKFQNGASNNATATVELNLATAYNPQTAAYTITSADSIVTADATSAAYAVTLPAANSVPAGRHFTVKKIDSSAHAVTLTAAGTDKIDGAATLALSAQYKYVTVISDGSANWFIVANN